MHSLSDWVTVAVLAVIVYVFGRGIWSRGRRSGDGSGSGPDGGAGLDSWMDGHHHSSHDSGGWGGDSGDSGGGHSGD